MTIESPTIAPVAADPEPKLKRSNSISQQSQTSETSQTAADFLREQEALEADAREALPYSIDSCTKILGSLRQNVFACLTCNPAPKDEDEAIWTPAGVCYACSVQCHGEHTLVEIFQKRNFTCDCGTKRIPSTTPCTLRTNDATNTRGDVHSEEPDAKNKYNHNFRNRFCGCACDYDPFQQKGTMFQCLGLGTHENGGCGEDWYHPGCLVGLGPKWFENMKIPEAPAQNGHGEYHLPTISEEATSKPIDEVAPKQAGTSDDDDPPAPPGFPEEEDFEGFVCHKCVGANPWIKRYAGTSGFLPPIYTEQPSLASDAAPESDVLAIKKRKADDEEGEGESDAKRVKSESETTSQALNGSALPSREAKPAAVLGCKLDNFPTTSSRPFSLFFKEGFREKFCRCSNCYPKLAKHPQLLEEEEVYEPPLSDGANSENGGGGSTHGSGSLLDRGESALRNIDRVRAIEGVMAYNHLKEQLTPFLKQFADRGEAIGAEHIKTFFAKLRGDEQKMKEAGEAAGRASGDGDGGGDQDTRKEQGGY